MTTKIVDVRSGNGTKVETLPKTQKVIHVDYTDPENGRQYGGDFTIKRLTIGEIRRVGVRRAELNGGMPEDSLAPEVRKLNTMVSHLDFAIVKAPEWWDPEGFYDGSIIMDVYEEVMSFEDTFRQAARQRASQAAADSAGSDQQPEHGERAETVVGEEVQTTANA